MFARRVYMHLKPNSVAEFTQRLEKDILPLPRGHSDNHRWLIYSGYALSLLTIIG